MKSSLPSMMMNVEGYFSLIELGIVPRTCSTDGIQLISFRCWYRRQTQVVMYVDATDLDTMNRNARSQMGKFSFNFISVIHK